MTALAAGGGLCAGCRHPARLHGAIGCTRPECWCESNGDELRAAVPSAPAVRVVPPSAAELERLDVPCVCGHPRTQHVINGKGVHCGTCACRQFAAGSPDAAPVATPAEASPDASVEARPSAVAPAAAPVEGDEQAEPVAPKRPRRPLVRPDTATRAGVVPVVGEPDVGEVAGASGGATLEAPVDLTPTPIAHAVLEVEPRPDVDPAEATRQVIASALNAYPAWYCGRCFQRRLEPGRCPSCRGALVPVHVLIIPRELA